MFTRSLRRLGPVGVIASLAALAAPLVVLLGTERALAAGGEGGEGGEGGDAAKPRTPDDYDRVVLKDGGTVIVGTIVSIDDASVSIRTPNGRELHFKMSDVQSVAQRKYKAAKKVVAEDDATDVSDDQSSAAASPPAADGEAPPKKKAPENGISRRGKGYALEIGGTLEEAEAKRQAWKKRGGGLFGFEVRATGSFTYMKTPSPPAGGCSGNIETTGFGGGAALGVNFLYLSPPNPGPTAPKNTLFMFNLGSGAQFDAFGTTVKMPACSGTYVPGYGTVGGTSARSTSSGSGLLTVPFPVGIAGGFGSFKDDKWSGAVVGLAYSPSMVLSIPFSGGNVGDPQFNPVGFQLNIDITSFDAVVNKSAEEAHFRISAFALPPIDKLPLLVTLGFGAVWY